MGIGSVDLCQLNFVRCKVLIEVSGLSPSNLSNYLLEKIHSIKSKTFLADPSSRVSWSFLGCYWLLYGITSQQRPSVIIYVFHKPIMCSYNKLGRPTDSNLVASLHIAMMTLSTQAIGRNS